MARNRSKEINPNTVVVTENKQKCENETSAASTDSLSLSNSNDIGSFYTVTRSFLMIRNLKFLKVSGNQKRISRHVKTIGKKNTKISFSWLDQFSCLLI